MGFMIPFVNRNTDEIHAHIQERMTETRFQKRAVLFVVSIALLLDNMLYMVIVPIVPEFLERNGAYDSVYTCVFNGTEEITYDTTDRALSPEEKLMLNSKYCRHKYASEDESLGYLFASKAALQLLVNPFSGALIDRIGYEVPMIFGLIVMFFSTTVFALGNSYGVLFFARSIQGLGSAFADTAGLAMIADRFPDENGERSAALGMAIAFISFGSLVAPPFGGLLYQTVGKPEPFLILAAVCLLDAILVFTIIRPGAGRRRASTVEGEGTLEGTPIWRLLVDPYIAACAGALVMANVSLAFLEPTIGKWMNQEMTGANEEVSTFHQGVIWFPAFFPHLIGVYATIWALKRHPTIHGSIAAAGLAIEGIACLMLPFCNHYYVLILPLSLLCFGIALMDTAILPLLGYLVDSRHVSVYGSIYAIADISYSLAYAVGPIIAGKVVASSSFKALNIGIAICSLLYAPILILLRSVFLNSPIKGTDKDGNVECKGITDGGGNISYGTTENKDGICPKNVVYRGYRETDAILDDEEDDDYDGGYN